MGYGCTVHRACSSYTGLPTFTTHTVKLNDEREFARVKTLCEDQTNIAGLLKSAVVPIRTDLNSISEDLFFPTLIHRVIRTEKSASVIFIAMAIIFDVATLPLRFITLIPRIVYNACTPAQEHPLTAFFKEKSIPTDDGELTLRLFKDGDRELTLMPSEMHARATQDGIHYRLYLSNREVPFSYRETTFGNAISIHEKREERSQRERDPSFGVDRSLLSAYSHAAKR